MADAQFLAFDLGAESGRAVLGSIEHERLRLQEIHRFPNRAVKLLGHLHWDVLRLWEEMKHGLYRCAQETGSHLDGIGVDTWGVDFALLGPNDTLLGMPYAYRDQRTDGIMEQAFQRMSREEMYQLTGIQFLQFNSVFQLLAMVRDDSPLLKVAERLLFMPGLFNFLLTREKVDEFTIGTTSQLYNPRTQGWATEIFEKLELPRHLMPNLVEPGTVIGNVWSDVAQEVRLSNIPVIAPAGHDTASAVAAVPAHGADWAYLSSGTWSLMGIEVPEPVITDETLRLNFTNEGGVAHTFRLLKNISGLWCIQECRRVWALEGQEFDYDQLTRLAAGAKPFSAFIDPDHPSLLSPPHMPDAVASFCEKTGQKPPESRGELIRCLLESLAFRYRSVLDMLNHIRGEPIRVLQVVGGGSRNELLNQFTANATGIPVVAGPAEATAVGNILVQAVARGVVSDMKRAREMVGRSFELRSYEPKDTEAWEEAYEKYRLLERRVIGEKDPH